MPVPPRFPGVYVEESGSGRHPFPVPTTVPDHTIDVLKTAVQQARLGNEEKLEASRQLDAQARRLEAHAGGPSLQAYLDEERRQSHRYGARSVFGGEPVADEATDVALQAAPRRSVP